jgi:hypothetical protein
MNCGIRVLGQTLVIDVVQVIAELVVALIERNTGRAAVQLDLSGCLDDFRAGKDAARRDPGGCEGVVVRPAVERDGLVRQPLARPEILTPAQCCRSRLVPRSHARRRCRHRSGVRS